MNNIALPIRTTSPFSPETKNRAHGLPQNDCLTPPYQPVMLPPLILLFISDYLYCIKAIAAEG